MEFLSKYWVMLSPVITLIIGILIPKQKVFSFIKKISSKLPWKSKKLLAEYLNAIEQGLVNDSYNGDYSIISNDQVSEAIGKARTDLGLEVSK